METVRLTQFSKAAGCGCKIAPAVLEKILKSDHTFKSEKLIVGYATNDDAAVYDLGNKNYLVSTTDFFMPIVDDAFDFGRIAATNALSDVYAMGGTPLMALAILGWPVEKLGTESAAEVLNGAREQCAKAGIPIAGGHSIESTEPIFGLIVNGMVSPEHLKKNNTVKEGDVLYMTKSLGTGVYSTALKREKLKEEDYTVLVNSMTELNAAGSEIAKLSYVTAMTDITGFGLAGHLLEMLSGNKLSSIVEKHRVKTFENLPFYIQQFIFPDNTTRNFNAYDENISGMTDLDFITYCDPQTSGGLLFTIEENNKGDFETFMREKNISASEIGRIVKAQEKKLVFV
jgi:selenide, water dikinase